MRNTSLCYIEKDGKYLMLHRIKKENDLNHDKWVGIGGKFEDKESPEDCILREAKEETGLTEDALKGLALRYITMRNKNGEVRQNYYYFAELKEGFDVQNSTEGRLEWHDMTALDSLPMPVTARHVVDHYLAAGRYTNQLYGGITTGEGPVFAAMDDF